MRYFCTLFDINYCSRGLTLYHSLQKHCKDFTLWILCMDDVTFDTLSGFKLEHARLIRLSVFEAGDDALLVAKSNRTKVEYYFTCTPSLPLFVLRQQPEVDLITYLDSDLFFYTDPEVLFEEFGAGSVGLIEHRFSERFAFLVRRGKYNCGWLSFRRDFDGLACANWWRERCNEWCYDREEGDRFADQKYLEQWPRLFDNVVVLKQLGANVGPWNLANFPVSITDSRVLIGSEPLVFFHFHGFRHLGGRLYDTGIGAFKVSLTNTIREHIFSPYLATLAQQNFELAKRGCSTQASSIRRHSNNAFRKVYLRLRRVAGILYNVILPGTYIIAKRYPNR
jgi:hypothetical protein